MVEAEWVPRRIRVPTRRIKPGESVWWEDLVRKEKELGREGGGEREKRGLPPEKDPEEMVK